MTMLLFRTAVCKCKPSYTGDPYTNCLFDPCSSSPCGQGAICENNGRAAICKCPPQHIGDPYVTCRYFPIIDYSVSETCPCPDQTHAVVMPVVRMLTAPGVGTVQCAPVEEDT